MKVLILSCCTGEGHNSAALAIKDELTRINVECEIIDPIAFKSVRAQHFVSSFYNNMIKKVPRTFGTIYKVGAIYDSIGITSPVYLANASYADTLNSYIEDNNFNAVICTHLFGMEVMTAIRKRLNSSIPSYCVLTDYTCIPFLSETELDGYFIPHDAIKDELIKKGIPLERIYSTGIPVSSKFNVHFEKKVARDMLSMPQDKKIFLIMTGGVGCENMLALCDEFMESCDDRIMSYILVGRNEDLQEKIISRYAGSSQINTVPFTREVNVYMNASDVMLSKSGGLSSTEAAVANIPFVSVKSIPGCETKNAEFFSSTGMSLCANNVKEAIEYAKSLSFDDKLAEEMRRAQQKTINPFAARDIVEKVLEK